MSLSRQKNRAWLRQRERTREQVAAHRATVARWQQTLELVKMVSATRDTFRDQLSAALKERTEMLQEIARLRELLGKHVVASTPSASKYAN